MAHAESPARLFLDSGVLIEGLLSSWSASRGALILGRCRLFRIVLADDVRKEVEENLTDLLSVEPALAEEAIAAYDKLPAFRVRADPAFPVLCGLPAHG